MIPVPNIVNLIPSPGLTNIGIGPIDIPIAIGIILTAFVFVGFASVTIEVLRKRIGATPPDGSKPELTLAHASQH